MKILDIALKDMLRSTRSLMGFAFMFAIPLLVTGMFYFMFGNMSGGGEFSLPRIRVVVANLDHGGPRLQTGSGNVPGGLKADTLSELVVEVLKSDDLADLLEISLVSDAESARAAVDSQQVQVAVIIPAGFSRAFADMNEQSSIEFYQDPTLTIGPGIVKAILNQFMDSLAGVKIIVDIAMDQLKAEQYGLIGPILERYLETSITQEEDLSAGLLEVHSPRPAAATQTDNMLAKMLGSIMGGMMIFYAFYTGAATGESILREEEERTLPRLFTTPTSQAVILSGKFLSVFLTVLVQVVVLLVASHYIFRIAWGDIRSVALVATGVIFSASSFGIFINSFLKDTKQGGVVFGGVLTVTGMLGMIRVFGMGSPSTNSLTNSVSLLTPQGWGVSGLLYAMNGEPVSMVLTSALGLLAWSVVFFVVGIWRFNHRYV